MGTRIQISTSGGGGATPVGATLMKTGQTTSYRTGDDGDIEAGRATDFFTLAVNNPFGNTARLTGLTGGYCDQSGNYFTFNGTASSRSVEFANDIMIDWSTYDNVAGTVNGYYYGALGTNRNWNDNIDFCLGLSVGTFTSGWRAINANEAMSIIPFGSRATGVVFGYHPVIYSTTGNIWTSTTNPISTTYALCIVQAWYSVTQLLKSSPAQAFAVRTFTVTGTTLT